MKQNSLGWNGAISARSEFREACFVTECQGAGDPAGHSQGAISA